MGFTNIVGFELDAEKAETARASGYQVLQGDFHDLSIFGNAQFDVVYSSHSLEHALYPDKVLREFFRVLKNGGGLKLVLPFPDHGPLDAHVAKTILGTATDDGGDRLTRFVSSFGFVLVSLKKDTWREPEIWIDFAKL